MGTGGRPLALRRQRGLVAALNGNPGTDPWIKHVAAGRLHIQLAWESRGGGRANTVTEENWRGFYANLRTARDHLVAAWRLAPALPEAPYAMQTVAMGGGGELGESLTDWFERTLEAHIDYTPAYQMMLGNALLPRWGGSYEQMLDLGRACLVNPRYDTVVPWQYIEAVRAVGEDQQRPWNLLADEQVYADVVRVAEGYAGALGKGKGEYYKTLHAAAAWRAGKLPEARRVLDELTAAGANPRPAAFVYLGADGGPEAVGSVYALTGRHADAVRAAEQQAAVNPKAAAAALAAVRKQQPADDPAIAYVDQQFKRSDAAARFAAGEWAPLQTGTTLGKEWRYALGYWRAEPDGVVVGAAEPGKSPWARLLWVGRGGGRDPGMRFELAGTVTFRTTVADPLEASGGITLGSTTDRAKSLWFFIDRKRQKAGVKLGDQPVTTVRDMPVRDGSTFRLRYDLGTIGLFLDDQPVGDSFHAPDGWSPDVEFWLCTYGGTPVAYGDLKVRRLADGEPKPGK